MEVTRKRLFYDIEVSFCEGSFWRTGWNQTILPHQVLQYPKIICISWKWEGKDEVHNLDWDLNKQCDKKLVKKFIKIMDSADEIIGYNSKRFDTKWVRTRAVYHGHKMRHTYNEVDVLTWVKKYLTLPAGNKLSEVCRYYELEAKLDSGGMQTWYDVVLSKDRKALDKMLWYCDGDILSLEAVFNKLEPYARPNMHYGVLSGLEKWSCPTCGTSKISVSKRYTTAAGTLQMYMQCGNRMCKSYRSTFKINNKTYMDFLQYKMVNGIK
jgi:hypothetical protein